MTFSKISNSISKTTNKITIKGILNAFLFCVIALFMTACGSNAADYAAEYGKSIKTDTLAPLPEVHSPASRETEDVTIMAKPQIPVRTVQDSIVEIKPVEEIAEQTVSNAQAEAEALITEGQKRLAALRAGKPKLATSPPIEGNDTLKPKPKSPAIPAYKCACMDIHTIQAGSTPTGVVAYYKGKYPKMTLKELERINQPKLLTPAKFRPGTKLCLKRNAA